MAAHLKTLIVLSSGAISNLTGIRFFGQGDITTSRRHRVIVIPDEPKLKHIHSPEEVLEVLRPHVEDLAEEVRKTLTDFLNEEVSGFIIFMPEGQSGVPNMLSQMYPRKLVAGIDRKGSDAGNARLLINYFLSKGVIRLGEEYREVKYPDETSNLDI